MSCPVPPTCMVTLCLHSPPCLWLLLPHPLPAEPHWFLPIPEYVFSRLGPCFAWMTFPLLLKFCSSFIRELADVFFLFPQERFIVLVFYIYSPLCSKCLEQFLHVRTVPVHISEAASITLCKFKILLATGSSRTHTVLCTQEDNTEIINS